MLEHLFGDRSAKTVPLAIRATRASDIQILASLHKDGFEKAWSSTEFDVLIGDHAVLGHIASGKDLKGIGFVLSRQAADEAEILSIVVARTDRGKGVGARLLAYHLSEATRNGVRRMFLEVEAGNKAALKLYHAYGFTEQGRRKSYYRKSDGTSADALIMVRAL